MNSYWNSLLKKRLSRRRAIAASTSATLGAAFLAACGGDDSSGGTEPIDTSGLLGKREDTTGKAVRGGIWPRASWNTAGIDPIGTGSAQVHSEIGPVYDTLLKWGMAVAKLPATDTITGDAAQSFELSPDGMRITLKLRENHRFDPRPPTSGRAMTAQDVKFSFDRAAAVSPLFASVYNGKNPTGGPILSMVTPDSQTITINLAFPYGAITEVLAYWYLRIMPVESDGQFDPRNEARGSGPYMLTTYEPDVRREYARNPNWYVKDRPFLDGFTVAIIPEYSARLAQFESKAIWEMASFAVDTIRPQDVLPLKRRQPRLVLLQRPMAMSLNHHFYVLSQREDSPFKDVRLRQAASMLYDRESFIEAMHNVSAFVNEGLPYETAHASHLDPKGDDWIDPRDTAFGPNAKYLQYNPEEAKKLVSASGFTGPIDFHWRTDSEAFSVQGEVLAGMFENAGLQVNRRGLNNQRWQELKGTAFQGYSGIFGNNTQGHNQDGLLLTKYTPGGRDAVSREAIPGVTDVVFKIAQELDRNRKQEMMKRLQQDLAPLMLDLPLEVYQDRYVVNWPWLKNFNVFQSVGFEEMASTGRPYTEYWYDKSEEI